MKICASNVEICSIIMEIIADLSTLFPITPISKKILGHIVYSRLKKKNKDFEKFYITSPPTSAGICRKRSSLNRKQDNLSNKWRDYICLPCWSQIRKEVKCEKSSQLATKSQPSKDDVRVLLPEVLGKAISESLE